MNLGRALVDGGRSPAELVTVFELGAGLRKLARVPRMEEIGARHQEYEHQDECESHLSPPSEVAAGTSGRHALERPFLPNMRTIEHAC